jgi:hypothetical protein
LIGHRVTRSGQQRLHQLQDAARRLREYFGGKSASSHATIVSASSILIGKRQLHQVQLRVQPREQRQRNLYHQQQSQPSAASAAVRLRK